MGYFFFTHNHFIVRSSRLCCCFFFKAFLSYTFVARRIESWHLACPCYIYKEMLLLFTLKRIGDWLRYWKGERKQDDFFSRPKLTSLWGGHFFLIKGKNLTGSFGREGKSLNDCDTVHWMSILCNPLVLFYCRPVLYFAWLWPFFLPLGGIIYTVYLTNNNRKKKCDGNHLLICCCFIVNDSGIHSTRKYGWLCYNT